MGLLAFVFIALDVVFIGVGFGQLASGEGGDDGYGGGCCAT